MQSVVCLDCFQLEETFNTLRLSPLESLVSYDNELNKFARCYDEDLFDETLGKLKCVNCKETIGFEDYFVEDFYLKFFSEEVCKIIAREVSLYIQFCEKCDIVKEIKYMERIDREYGFEKISILGSSVTEFLSYLDVPEKYFQNVVPFLFCKCCVNGYNHVSQTYERDSFNILTRLYTDTDLDKYLGVDLDEMSQYAEKHDIYIKRNEVTNFSTFLRTSPMLGLKHPVGQRLYELFQKMYDSCEYEQLDNIILYRGRTREKGSLQFTADKMWNPPLGISSHGRYNLVGSSVLYLTDDITSIPAEVNFMTHQELDVASIRIKKTLKVLDFSNMYGEFGRILSATPTNNNMLKVEYLLTNFIAECCKEIGFHGIKYSGVKKGDYSNLAILKYEKDVDLTIEEVKTVDVSIVYSIPRDEKVLI